MSVVFLNGEFVPQDEARVSVNDRGFVLADGIYEVTPAYRGTFFRLGEHLSRMRAGLKALRIGFDPSALPDIHEELLERNGLAGEPVSYVYVQVTRGVAPRTHAFPKQPVPPTVYAFANRFERPDRDTWERGFEAVTVPDRRWTRVDIKSIALLPNALAQQAAVDAGAQHAILVRDGVAIEGAHSNFFAVLDGTVVTHPKSNLILPGITRDLVLDLARQAGLPTEEAPIQLEDLERADELFFTGTTTEVSPCVRVDGRPIGDGTVGAVSRTLYDAFLAEVGAAAEAPVGAGV